MKNLRIVLAAWIVFLGYTFVSAQYDPKIFDVNQNTVVAVNGLKMRTKPSLKGKVISKIPYGEKVDIVDPMLTGLDTLDSNYKVYYTEEDYYEPLLSGYWVKARYDGEEGFVFSGFLFYQFEQERKYNKKVALLMEGGNCFDNLHYRPDWYWYGIYEEDGVHRLEKIAIDLLVEESELGPMMVVTTNKMKPSLFIIGTPQPLGEKRLFFSEYLGGGQSIYRGGEVEDNVLLKAALTVEDEEEDYHAKLIAIGRNGEQQVLNPEEPYYAYPITVQWYGDIDGDGKMDYLINFGEKNSKSILFLSSKAAPGQLVAPVGAYFSGYCC